MIRRRIPVAVLLVLGASLFGQQVSGPVLGYIWDAQIQGLRPLFGIPAASTVGAPLQTAEPLVAAAIAGRQNFAVVLAGESRAAALLFPQSANALQKLVGVRPGADLLELSPQGSAAAFYFAGENLIQVVGGLPARPSAPQSFSLAPLRQPMRSFTVSDDGALLLCAEAPDSSHAGSSAAVVLSPAGDVNRIGLSGPVTAAAFLDGTHDALLASGHELVLVRDVVAGVRTPLADTAVTPTMIAFGPGGRNAILADARTGWVAVRSLEGESGASVVLECHCRPSGLFPLRGEAAWRLTGTSESVLRLLDLAGGTARMLAVPPVIESSRQ